MTIWLNNSKPKVFKELRAIRGMNYSKIALGNAIGIFVLYFSGLSLISIPLAMIALGAGLKGLKQKGITKRDKIFSWIGIISGGGFLAFAALGFFLYYFIGL